MTARATAAAGTAGRPRALETIATGITESVTATGSTSGGVARQVAAGVTDRPLALRPVPLLLLVVLLLRVVVVVVVAEVAVTRGGPEACAAVTARRRR
jgi:hypothetical protein